MTVAHLGESGIELSGEPDQFGARWFWSGNDPWSPSPSPRSVVGERADAHGSWDATTYYGPRSYALEGYVMTDDHVDLHRAKARFFQAVGLAPFKLRVVEPGFDRFGTFRRDGEALWAEVNHTTATFSAPLWAGDPRAYSWASKSVTAGFPSSTGGLVWPATWPATWAATIVSGELQMSNSGTETSWPVFRIDGPVSNPSIMNASTGQVMRLDLVLEAGQWVTVDTGSHQVLAEGDPFASRRNLFWGDWFGLPPGVNTTVRFGGDASGVGAGLTATYRETWI